jgi:hypothetical protein
LPQTRSRELAAARFRMVAVYGSRRYRRGPVLETTSLVRIALTCPHVHYVATRAES